MSISFNPWIRAPPVDEGRDMYPIHGWIGSSMAPINDYHLDHENMCFGHESSFRGN